MNILLVLTSHDKLGQTGRKTGFWLEEFAAPYYVFKDADVQTTLASPLGGRPPMDTRSEDPAAQTPSTRRYMSDLSAQATLAHTLQLRQVTATRFDAVFYCGGHGPLWDLAEDPASIALIDALLTQGKPVAAVCHGPAVLRQARTREGTPVVQGRSVTGFSNTEEQAAGLTEVLPFLVEDMLTRLGGKYSKAADWESHVVVDGLLVTGQNPASSGPAAEALLALLRRRTPAP